MTDAEHRTVPTRRAKFRESMAALESAQKTPKGVSAYSRYVNRPIGRRLAAGAYVLDLTANQVTLLSGLFSFLGIGLIIAAPPSAIGGVAISLALLIGFALDSADGQLARLRHTGGRAGEWLDHVLDCAVKVALPLGVLISWYRAGRDDEYLVLALAFQVVMVVLFFAGTLADVLRRQSAADTYGRFHGTGLNPVAEIMRLFVDWGTVSLIFLLWGWPDAFTVAYVVLFLAHSAFLVAFNVHWFRELS